MKSGTCPKCGSPNIYHETNGVVYVPRSLGTFFKINGNMPSPVDDYLCVDCGYFEHYLADERKMQDIAKTWKKVE